MNIALENTEEFVNGVKRRAYGDAFIRGNNGMRLIYRFLLLFFYALVLIYAIVMYISADS